MTLLDGLSAASLLSFYAIPVCNCLVSGSFHSPAKGSFQLSVTLLLRYRSRDVFRVGSLCLPDSRAISNARYSGYLESTTRLTSTGLSPSMEDRSSTEFQVDRAGGAKVHNSTRPAPRRRGVRFALHPLRSPLLRASR